MLAAYVSAAVLCLLAARQCADHPCGPLIRTIRRERRLWEAMAVFLALLAVYRQFDLADLITGTGRTIAVHGKWYDHRRWFQSVALGISVVAVVWAAIAIARSMAGVNPLALGALAGCTMLVLLLGTGTLSLHWTDLFLHSGYHRAKVYNVIELGSLATILVASLRYRRERMAGPQR